MADQDTKPITGLCIVADPQKCPPNYDLVYKSHDKKEDCDLWKDGSVFGSKQKRYLCFSKAPPLAGAVSPVDHVVVDIIIQNEKDLPPGGYMILERTIDTSERAIKKKQIAYKMVPRSSVTDAVSEIIMLSRSKRPPPGYSQAGEINNLVVCLKTTKLPAQQSPSHAGSAPAIPNRNGVVPPLPAPRNLHTNSGVPAPPLANSVTSFNHVESVTSMLPVQLAVTSKQEGTLSQNPMALVPFQLNPRFVNDKTIKNLRDNMIPTMHYRSLIDIENEFNYAFTLERTAVQRLPSDSYM